MFSRKQETSKIEIKKVRNNKKKAKNKRIKKEKDTFTTK